MGVIRVVIESESGQRKNEGVMLPSNVFPNPADTRFCCLRFVDPYGDATFNRLQMPFVLADLRRLKEELSDDSVIKTLDLVETMAKECEDGIHLYMKFLGD